VESEHYGLSKEKGIWGGGLAYEKAIQAYRASYASIHWWPREFRDENKNLIDRINRILGYRILPTMISWPKRVLAGRSIDIESAWINEGVAPCYAGGYPAITIKDRKEGISGVFVMDSLNMSSLSPGMDKTGAKGVHVSAGLPFDLVPGSYNVFVSVGRKDGTPVMALPLSGDDGQRRYRVGALEIGGAYAIQSVDVTALDQERMMIEVGWVNHSAFPQGARPFLHFDKNGGLVFQGEIIDWIEPRPGQVTRTKFRCRIPVTKEKFDMEAKFGIWVSEKAGMVDERFFPDCGDKDRRIVLGIIRVAQKNEGKRLEFIKRSVCNSKQ
jgi:hypothetical protein